MENNENMQPTEQKNLQQTEQNASSRNISQNDQQQSEELKVQDQPLKNNDHDVDPSNPRHSSLGHR